MSIAPDILAFKRRLKRVTDAAGYAGDQKRLAADLLTSQSTVSPWLTLDRTDTPKAPALIKLGQLLGVSLHWLLTGDGPETPPEAAETAIYDSGRAAGWHEAVESLRGLHAMLSATAGVGVELSPEILELARRVLEAASNPKADQRPEQPPGDAETG